MEIRNKMVFSFSNYSLENTVPIEAKSLGATVIEKHFTADKFIGGTDGDFSLDFDEFSSMIKAVREAEKALEEVTYKFSDKVQKIKKFARSLFAVKDINKEEEITEKNIRSVRPVHGLPPKYYKCVIGKKVMTRIERETPLTLNDFVAEI